MYKFNEEDEKSQNLGITLIALVITIIIILVLAGISIMMVTGDNGIIKQATDSVEKYSESAIYEEINMAVSGLYNEEVSEEYLKDKLNMGTIEDYDSGNFRYCTNKKDYMVSIVNKTVYIRESTGIKAIDFVQIGDFINYDAGIWNETKGNPSALEFGNYTTGNNRGKSIINDLKSGWRVLYKDDNGAIALIHAGIPEKFNLYYSGTTYGVLRANATQILSGNNITGVVENYNHTPRDWNNYTDRIYAKETHCLSWDDITNWSEDKNIAYYNFETSNDLIKLGYSYYYIHKNTTYNMKPDGTVSWANGYGALGIRVVVILKKGVEIKSKEKGTDVFGNEAWILN